jgi:HD-GYP domain-containing protein (c-di-GMP phosphodiesterase class II)
MMVAKSLAVLIAGRVDDVLVLRRLLRETSYRVDGVTGATQALRAITQHSYSAVVADDDQIQGLSGAKLLSHVEELQPGALRLLIAPRERRPQLANQSLSGRFQLFVRPYFAAPIRDALVAHERAASSRRRTNVRDEEPAPRDERPREAREAREPMREAREPMREGREPMREGREPMREAAREQAREPVREPRRTEVAERPRRSDRSRKIDVRPQKRPAPRQQEHFEESTVAFGGAIVEDDTKPYALVSGGTVARRRLLLTMAELAEATLGHGSGHALRVAALAVALGRAIGLSAADVDALDEAALLHDVGELAASITLWRVPRRLSQAELQQVHLHAQASHVVAQRCGAAKPALLAVRHHHERWDGRGYPDGLARAAIPVTARVLAVADTWDALATARPYRDKQPPAQCARTLRAAGGLQLDPALVELFLARRIHEAIDWADPPRAADLLPPAPTKPVAPRRARAG